MAAITWEAPTGQAYVNEETTARSWMSPNGEYVGIPSGGSGGGGGGGGGGNFGQGRQIRRRRRPIQFTT